MELARILFSGADVLLLDEPTNHLDADSIRWLREFLRSYAGGFIVISHDAELLADTVNKIWHLDAQRQEIDQYAMGWAKYLEAREVDERRRRRERRNAEQQAAALRDRRAHASQGNQSARSPEHVPTCRETRRRPKETADKTGWRRFVFPTRRRAGRSPWPGRASHAPMEASRSSLMLIWLSTRARGS